VRDFRITMTDIHDFLMDEKGECKRDGYLAAGIQYDVLKLLWCNQDQPATLRCPSHGDLGLPGALGSINTDVRNRAICCCVLSRPFTASTCKRLMNNNLGKSLSLETQNLGE